MPDRLSETDVEELREQVRRMHRALSEGYGVEDGGVWEDRALAAEAKVERLRAALDDLAEAAREFSTQAAYTVMESVEADFVAALDDAVRLLGDDRQPYPTADAYEKVCAALRRSEAENEHLCALVDQARPCIVEALNCSAHSWHGSDEARRWLIAALDEALSEARGRGGA